MGKNNGSFLLGAIVGGVVGAATALFFTSDKGKKWVAEINVTGNLEPIKTKATEWLEIAKEKTKEVAKRVPAAKDTESNMNEQENEGIELETEAIRIPVDNNKEAIDRLLKETEQALSDAEQKKQHPNEAE
ncbi:YtxH domain-containing protein [Anoxybacteroides rupiense]|jgi:gas vesicle protein|uniref:YtxH domain-containing protein n=1 Tax=Anoxybacteroides rupiense TaxID=311460 RepID=A0ABD5ISA6_9BACL|nr:YtxH domain-containing protein [Anoxybacillus rupiensis]MBB3907026.1 gas vesicle protein [Anoxybacillus rupiensis]MBS2771446.1 YtxH domain-containing protein [Anoxybacillus rupiensis]MED5051187.1 YtxH domain-containing protein [Anoxybacillus rupiensis]